MTLNACVFLSFSINQAKKLNCLFIYLFFILVPPVFYVSKKIAASPNNFVGRKLFSKVNTRTINYNSLREATGRL